MIKPKRRKASLAAMDYLAMRDHSEKELRQKLSKNYTPEEIAHAIEYVSENGWMMNPVELAQKVSEMLHNKKKGYLYICQYLREKGLPQVNKVEELEIEKGLAIIAAKLELEPPFAWETKPKVQRLLVNRGFDPSTIRNILK
jgi:regulatory protein